MVFIRKGCLDCDVELDEAQPMEEYPTTCFKCGKDLTVLDP